MAFLLVSSIHTIMEDTSVILPLPITEQLGTRAEAEGKMVLLNGLLQDLVENLQIADIFATLPFKWNPQRRRLELKSGSKMVIYKLRVGIASLYLLLALVQIIWTWKKAGRMVMTHSAMFVADYLTNLTSQFLNYRDPKATIDLFNSVIEYEEKRFLTESAREIKNEKGRRVTKFLMQMMAATGIFMPPLYHLDILRNPCFPMYVGFWLSDQCNVQLGLASPAAWTWTEFGTKAGISLFSYLNWSFVLTSHCFHTSVGMVLLGHCIRTYISQYGSEISLTKGVTPESEKRITRYRELQVLSMHHRSIYSTYFLAYYTICMTVVAVVCLYSTVKAAYEKETVQLGLNLLYFWCTFVTAFILVFIIGILADVYRVSKKVNRQMTGKVALKRNKWYQRFLRTCRGVRIYIGGTNFYDVLTPLTLESFAISQTVSLLLLK